jgi:hypothetical protein
MSESKIQAECYQWFNNNYCLFSNNPRGLMFSIPNELAGNNAVITMQAKAMGLTAGVSDTIVILPNSKVLFIEFKNDVGRQSVKQKEFEERVNKLGFNYFIVRCLVEFKTIIENANT